MTVMRNIPASCARDFLVRRNAIEENLMSPHLEAAVSIQIAFSAIPGCRQRVAVGGRCHQQNRSETIIKSIRAKKKEVPRA